MTTVDAQAYGIYRDYVRQWYTDHKEGHPASFEEWYDNECQESEEE